MIQPHPIADAALLHRPESEGLGYLLTPANSGIIELRRTALQGLHRTG